MMKKGMAVRKGLIYFFNLYALFFLCFRIKKKK